MVDIYNRLCVILSNGIVFASYYSERRLSEQFPDVPVMVRRISGLSEPSLREGIGNYAIWFGRSETYKGLESIGPIAKNLCERAPKLRILVAGRGVTNRLNGAEKFNNVDVLDEYINDEELADLVARSFCCILPYTSATQSGVAVFSLGMGVPVVAFDLGAFSEQIINNENGLLVQPGDLDAFADAILTIFGSKRRFADLSTKKAELYSLNKYLEETKHVISRVKNG